MTHYCLYKLIRHLFSKNAAFVRLLILASYGKQTCVWAG